MSETHRRQSRRNPVIMLPRPVPHIALLLQLWCSAHFADQSRVNSAQQGRAMAVPLFYGTQKG